MAEAKAPKIHNQIDIVNPNWRMKQLEIDVKHYREKHGGQIEPEVLQQMTLEHQRTKYMRVPLPEDASGAEVRVNVQGYSIYFDRREERQVGKIVNDKEQRVSHTEIFFNADLEEKMSWIRYTEWEPVPMDRSIITPVAIFPGRDNPTVKPS